MRKFIHTNLQKYLPEFVYGSIDGTITTFAIVAGIAGAQLSPAIALVLGVANVLADGFSMASSNYLSEKSRNQKGLEVTESNAALKTAFVTFLSFVSVGFVPILPFMFGLEFYKQLGMTPFFLSTIFTCLAFIFIGVIRGKINNENKWKTSLETLAIGSLAAFISYFVGVILRDLI